MREGSYNQTEFIKHMRKKVGTEFVDTINTSHTDTIYQQGMNIGIGLVLFLTVFGLVRPDWCGGLTCFAIVIGFLFFIPLMDQGDIVSRSRIKITKKGIIFPDLETVWKRSMLPGRHAIGFDELTKIQILKKEIVFTVEDDITTISKKHVPDFKRLRESLKKAFKEYRDGGSGSPRRYLEEELEPFMELAQGYGFFKGWEMERFKHAIDDLYAEMNEQKSIQRFLKHAIRSLEDILVTSFTYGFFVLPGFKVDEVIDGANDCLIQYRMELITGKECSSYELEHRFRQFREGGQRDILELPIKIRRELYSSKDPTEIMHDINQLIDGIGLVFLLRGKKDQDPDEPAEFLLAELEHANRIIVEGKLSFRWV